MTPTNTQINELIASRNCLTNRRDELIDLDAVDHIDNILRDVPAGQRNDVDLLLGRSCAVLPKRKSEVKRVWSVNPAYTLDNLPAETKELIEMTRRIWRDAKPIEY